MLNLSPSSLVPAFHCSYPKCAMSFTVRSNATRHLRTHGFVPDRREESPAPYTVGFCAPLVCLGGNPLEKAPVTLRWVSLNPPEMAPVVCHPSSSSGRDDGDDSVVREYTGAPLRPVRSEPVLGAFPPSYSSNWNEEMLGSESTEQGCSIQVMLRAFSALFPFTGSIIAATTFFKFFCIATDLGLGE
jgi:hypothetical protein